MGGIYLDIKARTELRAKYTREDGNYTPEEKVINAVNNNHDGPEYISAR